MVAVALIPFCLASMGRKMAGVCEADTMRDDTDLGVSPTLLNRVQPPRLVSASGIGGPPSKRFETDTRRQETILRLYTDLLDRLQSGHIDLDWDFSRKLCFVRLGDLDPALSAVHLGLFPQPYPMVTAGLFEAKWLVVLTCPEFVRTAPYFADYLKQSMPQFFHEMTHVLDLFAYKNRTELYLSGTAQHIDLEQHDNMPSEINALYHQVVRAFESCWDRSAKDPSCTGIMQDMASNFRSFLTVMRGPTFMDDFWGRLTEDNKQSLTKRLYSYWDGRFGKEQTADQEIAPSASLSLRFGG